MDEGNVEELIEAIRQNPLISQTELSFGCPPCGGTIRESAVVRHAAWHRDLRAAIKQAEGNQ